MTQYNGGSDQQRWKKFCFPARLICADCYEVKITINGAAYLINQTKRDADMYTPKQSAIVFSQTIPTYL
jgi:hypothetical protein